MIKTTAITFSLSFAFLLSYTQSLPTTTQPRLLAPGIISTGNYETHAAFSPSGDTIYFLKCTADLNICSINVSYKTKDNWSIPVTVPFSGKYLDVDPFFTKDGKTLYFVSNRPIHKGDSLHNDWDIWKAERTANGWGEPVHLDAPINSASSEFYPTIADNGNLYFGSNRPGGKGASDIYCARWENNHWLQPENLGEAINTTDNQYEPFIAPDESYLIYMATIPGGLINGDFYISHRMNGQWSKAVKLASPINSPATEWAPKVTRNGKYFYFGSTRNNVTDSLPGREPLSIFKKRLNSAGNGLGDIYYVDFSAIQETKTSSMIQALIKTDKAILSELNAQFIKNFITQDTAAHNEIIYKDFICIESSGAIVQRNEYMKDWAHAYENSGYTSFSITDENIRIFGDMALVRSKTVYTKTVDGKEAGGNSVYTDTYIKENGRWWCVQAHITGMRK